MDVSHFDLAVAGAGIMGLSCALEAAKSGKSVLVFDPALDSAKASWAAAGILVTRDARHFLSPFREFYVRSIHLYPAWLAEISKVSGQEIPLHRGGDFQIYALDTSTGSDQFTAKLKQLEREKARDFNITEGPPGFLRGFSNLENCRTLHFPQEGYVQNRDLLDGLLLACKKAGVQFISGKTSGSWRHSYGTTQLDFDSRQVTAKQVLIAAGAWTGEILSTLGISAPMIPVKGQMCRIPKFYPQDCMVHFNEDIYLVPRGDTLVVGATTEPRVWTPGFDEVGKGYVEKHLNHFLPGIDKSTQESWAGFRPRTKDRLPWMGWIDADRGWALCAGHYKCGISMAPLAAQSMTRLMKSEKPPIDLTPFQPWRRQGLEKLASGVL